MKNENKSHPKFMLITAALTFISVLSTILVIFLFLKKITTTDAEFTEIVAPDQIVLDAGDETLPQSILINDDGIAVADGNSAANETESYAARYLMQLENHDNFWIEESFTIEDHIFYHIGTGSLNPSENFLDAREAAQTALAAFQQYFPERSWDFPFYVQLAPATVLSFSYSSEEAGGVFWYVHTVEEYSPHMYGPMIYLHPLTGDIIMIFCSYTDPVYNGATNEGFHTPFLSLNDFFSLTRDSDWINAGTEVLRKLDLTDGEASLYYDREIGIHFSRQGNVRIPFTIGSGESAAKINVYLDLYTKDFVGYMVRTQ